MYKSIYKYEVIPETEITVPEGSKILSVGTQINGGTEGIYVWIAVTTSLVKETLRLIAVGTGQEFPVFEEPNFIGTVHFQTVKYVFHIFQLSTISNDDGSDE